MSRKAQSAVAHKVTRALPAAKVTRVLLADDHHIFRQGLRLLLQQEPDLRIAGEAATGKEVLKKARALRPDIILMDLSMPDMNGLQATLLLKHELPNVLVIALTMHEDENYLLQLCKAGAMGYVLKRSAPEELIQAIRTVAAGGAHFDPTLSSRVLSARGRDPVSRFDLRFAELSPREKQVLLLLAWGRSNKEVGAELQISVKTVETYRLRISEKLGFRSRTQMVQYALRQGWLAESGPANLAWR